MANTSYESCLYIEKTELPNTFRTPISLVRRLVVKSISPNNPIDETTSVTTENMRNKRFSDFQNEMAESK